MSETKPIYDSGAAPAPAALPKEILRPAEFEAIGRELAFRLRSDIGPLLRLLNSHNALAEELAKAFPTPDPLTALERARDAVVAAAEEWNVSDHGDFKAAYRKGERLANAVDALQAARAAAGAGGGKE